MALTVEEAQGRVLVTVLAIQGDLDYSNYQEVIERVQVLFGGGCRHLVIDLSEVPFIASSGLIALHSAVLVMDGQSAPDTESGWQAFHDLGSGVSDVQTNVKLVGLRPRVEQTLQRTALLRYFETFEDRAAAIDSF
jgi:anti-anti-sigma regulatory factor